MDIRIIKKKINQWIGNYLTYNRTEQRGILVLSLILLGVIIVQALIPAGTLQKKPDFLVFSAEIAAFEAAWKKAADSDSMARAQKYSGHQKKSGTYRHDSGFRKGASQQALLMVDLNSADTFELQQLRGIGPAYSRWIVAYRERLHGFYEPRQLLEVYGIDSTKFALIKPNLKVTRDSIHPIDLNRVTFKELLRHPYFPFAITKNIMIYRQKNKAFKTLEELKSIQGVNDSLFRRMVIYLRVGP